MVNNQFMPGFDVKYREGSIHTDLKDVCRGYSLVKVSGKAKTKELRRTLSEIKYRLSGNSGTAQIFVEKASIGIVRQRKLSGIRCVMCVYSIDESDEIKKNMTVKRAANMLRILHSCMGEEGSRVVSKISAYSDGSLLLVVRKVALDDGTER